MDENEVLFFEGRHCDDSGAYPLMRKIGGEDTMALGSRRGWRWRRGGKSKFISQVCLDRLELDDYTYEMR